MIIIIIIIFDKKLLELTDEMKLRESRWAANNARLKERIETLEREKAELKESLKLAEKQRIESLMKVTSGGQSFDLKSSFKQSTTTSNGRNSLPATTTRSARGQFIEEYESAMMMTMTNMPTINTTSKSSNNNNSNNLNFDEDGQASPYQYSSSENEANNATNIPISLNGHYQNLAHHNHQYDMVYRQQVIFNLVELNLLEFF